MKKQKFFGTAIALLLMYAMVFASGISAKAEDVDESEIIKNDETGIPDETFYRLAVKQCDADKDGVLTKSEAEACEQLNFDGLLIMDSIYDIRGIEYFTNLVHLDLHVQYVQDISPVANLKKLEWFDACYVGISDVSSLAGLTNLKEIRLCHNNITDISSLKNLTELEFFEVDYNQIEDVSVLENFENLHYAGLSNNKIKITGDLSVLNDPYTEDYYINELDLSNNEISDLSGLKGLSDVEQFKKINLSNNKISDISVLESFKYVEILNLSGNEIVDVTPIKGLLSANLNDLNLANNKISDIAALSIGSIVDLNLSQNEISDISALEKLDDLNEIHLNDNNLEDISALSGADLYKIEAANNKINDISALSNCDNLTEIDLSNNQISDIGALAGKKITSLNLSKNRIKDISPLADAFGTWSLILDLSENQISDISMLSTDAYFHKVDLSYNKIKDVSVLTNWYFYGLYLNDNEISEIPELNYWCDPWFNVDFSNNNISHIAPVNHLEYQSNFYFDYDSSSEADKSNSHYWKIAQGNPISREDIINAFPEWVINAQMYEYEIDEDGYYEEVEYSWLEWQGLESAYVEDSPVVTKEDFDILLTENQSQDVVIKSNDGILFTFKKGTMAKVDGITDYDFSVVVTKEYKNIKDLPKSVSDKDFIVKIDYKYSGKLPAEAFINIPIGKEYAGKTVYYSELSKDGTVSLLQSAIADKNGNITVKQSHCSSYLITLNEISENGGSEENGSSDNTSEENSTDKPSDNNETAPDENNGVNESENTPKTGDDGLTVTAVLFGISVASFWTCARKKIRL